MNTVSVFNLDSDDLKGQITYWEGRNICALEAATAPRSSSTIRRKPLSFPASTLSAGRYFRLALKRPVRLLSHPPCPHRRGGSKARKQLDEQIVEIGERTVIDLDIHGPGRQSGQDGTACASRSSYYQNLPGTHRNGQPSAPSWRRNLPEPQNSQDTKRAYLLHDIGK